MYNKLSNWLAVVLTAAVGVVFIVWYQRVELFNWLAMALGVSVVIPSLVVLVTALRQLGKPGIKSSRKASLGSMALVAGVSIGFGVWMVCDPHFFVSFFTYLFAVVLMAYGVCLIALSAIESRPYSVPWGFYIVPSLMIVAGLIIVVTGVHALDAVVTLITGIMLVCAAVNRAMELMAMRPVAARGSGN